MTWQASQRPVLASSGAGLSGQASGCGRERLPERPERPGRPCAPARALRGDSAARRAPRSSWRSGAAASCTPPRGARAARRGGAAAATSRRAANVMKGCRCGEMWGDVGSSPAAATRGAAGASPSLWRARRAPPRPPSPSPSPSRAPPAGRPRRRGCPQPPAPREAPSAGHAIRGPSEGHQRASEGHQTTIGGPSDGHRRAIRRRSGGDSSPAAHAISSSHKQSPLTCSSRSLAARASVASVTCACNALISSS